MESSASSLMAARINRDLNKKMTDLSVMAERERQRRAMLEKELKRSEEDMSMLELMEYERRLLELKGEVGKWVAKREMWSKYGMVGVSNVGGVLQQCMPVKNEMVINDQGVREYFEKNEAVTYNNGYFLAYENSGGGGVELGFGNTAFFGGFQ